MNQGILVTGGAGFLGSSPCYRLIKNSHDLQNISQLMPEKYGSFYTFNKYR